MREMRKQSVIVGEKYTSLFSFSNPNGIRIE